MSYKKKATSNRDALFGGAAAETSSAGPKHKRNAAANRNALLGDTNQSGNNNKSSKSRPSTSSNSNSNSNSRATTTNTNTSRGYKSSSSSKKQPISTSTSMLSPEAKAAKLKEAETYKTQANKAMQRGLFSKPDPVAASTLFKRAADAYQQVGGEFARKERYYRVASGDCNLQIGAWASAANDYTRAAELVLQDNDNDNDNSEDLQQKRLESSQLHKKASEAWMQMNEKSKAAASQVQAALVLNYGEEGTLLTKQALAGIEEAVEAHVPDLFNPYARYRQTGHSAFVDADNSEEETIENPSEQTMQMAREHLVSRSYAHEPLQELVTLLAGRFGEYASALYAAGAATFLLEKDGISTLSLSRAYVVETILMLAMGDPVAAEQTFLNKHVQKTFYLKSRECKLAEDLFRAVKMRDDEALEEARSPSGSNRAALANLDESMRVLTSQLRVSGVARKKVEDTTSLVHHDKKKKKKSPKSASASSSSDDDEDATEPKMVIDETAAVPSLQELMNKKTGYEKEAQEGAVLDSNALSAELDELDFGDDDDDDDDGEGGDLDEDDFDLR